jgi:predicted glutamine amidotransferase
MCGISGYITNNKTLLKKSIIKTLGVFNDSRGGDSCGLFIDGEIEYGVEKNKLFSSFIDDSKLLKDTSYANIVFSHCRKRSVGTISVETAQPVVFYNDSDEIDFCLMHNGTIHNADKLYLSHYNERPPNKLTDSQIMAKIFYDHGYDDLEKYIGTAVFVIADFRMDKNNPEILFFKGESKATESSAITSEERPLFFSYDKNCLLFSSIDISLKCVSESEVEKFLANKLYKYKNGQLIVDRVFDRTNNVQSEQAFHSFGFNNIVNNNHSYNNDYYDYYEGRQVPQNDGNASKSFFSKRKKNKKIALSEISLSSFDNTQSNCKLSFNTKNGFIYYNGQVADGKYNSSAFGYNSSVTEELWFFNGFLLLGKKNAYDLLNYLYDLNKKYYPTVYDFVKKFKPLIARFSAYPIWDENRLISSLTYERICGFDGKFTIPFSASYRILYVNNGIIKDIDSTNYRLFTSEFKAVCKRIEEADVSFDREQEIELYNNFYYKNN